MLPHRVVRSIHHQRAVVRLEVGNILDTLRKQVRSSCHPFMGDHQPIGTRLLCPPAANSASNSASMSHRSPGPPRPGRPTVAGFIYVSSRCPPRCPPHASRRSRCSTRRYVPLIRGIALFRPSHHIHPRSPDSPQHSQCRCHHPIRYWLAYSAPFRFHLQLRPRRLRHGLCARGQRRNLLRHSAVSRRHIHIHIVLLRSLHRRRRITRAAPAPRSSYPRSSAHTVSNYPADARYRRRNRRIDIALAYRLHRHRSRQHRTLIALT